MSVLRLNDDDMPVHDPWMVDDEDGPSLLPPLDAVQMADIPGVDTLMTGGGGEAVALPVSTGGVGPLLGAGEVPAAGTGMSGAAVAATPLKWGDVSGMGHFGVNALTGEGLLKVASTFVGLGQQAELAGLNAGQYTSQAEQLRIAGSANYRAAGINMMRAREEQRRYLGRQTVGAVNSGFAVGSGSTQAVVKDTMSVFEQQIHDMRYRADVARSQSDYEARLMDWRAGQARRQKRKAGLGQLGSLLGAAVGGGIGGPVGMGVGSQLGGGIFSM